MPTDGRARPRQGGFQTLLDQSVEEGLRYVLGESGLQMVLALYPLEDLSKDPGEFHLAMASIFKPRGAAMIEQEIARRLLDLAGDQRMGAGRKGHRWLSSLRTGERRSGTISASDMKTLRRFAALASLPEGDEEGGPALPASRRQPGVRYARFAAAFKTGR